MTITHCYICNTDHDPDDACVPNRPHPAEDIGPNDLAYPVPPNDLFDDAAPASPFGPVFTAEFESEDACCGEGILPGEDIRADGQGGWIHADDGCERMAS